MKKHELEEKLAELYKIRNKCKNENEFWQISSKISELKKELNKLKE